VVWFGARPIGEVGLLLAKMVQTVEKNKQIKGTVSEKWILVSLYDLQTEVRKFSLFETCKNNNWDSYRKEPAVTEITTQSGDISGTGTNFPAELLELLLFSAIKCMCHFELINAEVEFEK
jgi:hypothetical protein